MRSAEELVAIADKHTDGIITDLGDFANIEPVIVANIIKFQLEAVAAKVMFQCAGKKEQSQENKA